MKTDIIAVDPENKFEVAQTDKPTAFIPAGFHSVLKFSELIAVSGMAPQFKSVDQVAVAIFHGLEVGLTPMAALQSIAIVNGRASIWGDGALAMVRASGQLEDIEEFYEGTFPNDDFKAVCIVTRKNSKRPVRQEFSIADAKLAGLWTKDKTPWQTYPKRMLKMRARSWALRDEFTDVMRGLIFAEEAGDFDDMRDVTPKREEPPASPPEHDDTAKPGRGRKKKDAPAPTGNQYQDGKAGGDVTDAEVISEKKAAEKPAQAQPNEQVLSEQQQKAAASEDPPAGDDAAKEAADFVAALCEEIGANKPLKEYIHYANGILMPCNTLDEMKTAWLSRNKMKDATKSEEVFYHRLRDWHKERIGALPASGAPGNEEPPREFDLAGFLHELDVKLGAEKTPDGVNAVYARMTEPAIKAGAVTAAQVDDDLKPLLVTHLERADYGG